MEVFFSLLCFECDERFSREAVKSESLQAKKLWKLLNKLVHTTNVFLANKNIVINVTTSAVMALTEQCWLPWLCPSLASGHCIYY